MRGMIRGLASLCVVLTVLVFGGAEAVLAQTVTTEAAPLRERISIDKDWRFAYGNAADPSQDFGYGTRPFFFAKAGYGDGPAAVNFDDRGWRQLDVPHDWAVELPFDSRGDTNHGSKAIGAAFPQNSIGWYRKSISLSDADRGRRISLTFDGVYRDSILWFNGHYIGTQPSGYTSFTYDVTDYVNYDGPNVIAMRVDASGEEGWFYEGAGIYRHVWLTKTAPVHVAPWGTFVSSDVQDGKADLSTQVKITNDSRDPQTVTIEDQVYDPAGQLVTTRIEPAAQVDADSTISVTGHIAVDDARLWSLETPQLYKLVTLVHSGDQVVDHYETPFGIRTIRFDEKAGFFLNGKHVELKGVDIHQDFAGVGVAVPDSLETYRLKRLQLIGVNALRLSHNPVAPELLDAADRLGFLVIDEHRMMGTTPEIRGQLEAMVTRDRNHPSVILWSVGNEEWALEWNEEGTRLADAMQWIVHRLDPTRRTTAAVSGSGQGVSLADDVVGFNYRTQHDIDGFHAKYPQKPMVMTEEGSTTATRGIYADDPAAVHLAAYDREARPGNSSSIEEGWRAVLARPFMSGMFVWTGFDYRGEPTPFGWPAISSQFGMLDTTGVIKDSGYYLQSVWTEAPMVHILPHWTAPPAGSDGKVAVWVYSNTDQVELFLNGKSLGRKTRVADSHLEWAVPYTPGTLSAKAYRGGRLVATTQVATTGAPVTLAATADRTALAADGKDVSVVMVHVTDTHGRVVPDDDTLIHFATQGPIRIIGVGNGDPGSHEPDKVAERYRYLRLNNWHSLAVDDGTPLPDLKAVDTSSWRDPFQWLPPEKQPPVTKTLVLRGEFARPDLAPGESLNLFVPNLGAGQTVYVNGEPAITTATDGGDNVTLDPARLKDVNSLTYVFDTPTGGVPKLADASQNGVNWAILKVVTPAAAWQRHLFSGYAAVLVQATDASGTGTLTATADGMAPARVVLTTQ